MRLAIADPSSYTPPYDHALCAALAAEGLDVELLTSRFDYGETAAPVGYRRREIFYPRSHKGLSSGRRGGAQLALKLSEHLPGMLRLARRSKRFDLIHFQWLTVPEIDWALLPRGRPLVLTAHDVAPREPRPGQLRATKLLYERFDAIVVHSEHGRRRLIERFGVAEERVSVIPHGIFRHLAEGSGGAGDGPAATGAGGAEADGDARAAGPQAGGAAGPPGRPERGRVVLFFGLLRPYKGLDVLLEAWRSLSEQERAGSELWIAGMPRMDVSRLQASAGADGVRLQARFIGDEELRAWFAAADLVVLPYREADQSGVLFTALAFGKPLLLSDVGGFGEIARTGAASLVPPGDAEALAGELRRLLGGSSPLEAMAERSRALGAEGGALSWQSVAKAHVRLYQRLLA